MWKKIKRMVSKHRSLTVAVVAVGICVAVLAFFIPNNPKALDSPFDATEPDDIGIVTGLPANITTKANYALSVSISGPKQVTPGPQYKYKYTLKVKNTGNSSSLVYKLSAAPVAATWSFSSIGIGATKIIDAWLVFPSGSSWNLSLIGISLKMPSGAVTNAQDTARFTVKKAITPPPQPPTSWNGTGCLGYNTNGTRAVVCNYLGMPFRLTGYSKGGASTLSYVIQCRKDGWPGQNVVIYPRVWYQNNQSIKGNFTIYGKKATLNAAAKYCSNKEKIPVLIATLKPGQNATVNLTIKLSSTFPWGK
jgi:hypothetical protein